MDETVFNLDLSQPEIYYKDDVVMVILFWKYKKGDSYGSSLEK